jgi:hypothetical protein
MSIPVRLARVKPFRLLIHGFQFTKEPRPRVGLAVPETFRPPVRTALAVTG